MTATVTPIRTRLAAVTPIRPTAPAGSPDATSNLTAMPIAAAALYDAAQRALGDARAIRDGAASIAHEGMTREQSAQVYLQLGCELLALSVDFANG